VFRKTENVLIHIYRICVYCREGVFGLWLEERMGTGSSRPVVTYDNPCLASEEEFEVEQVEVWALVKSRLF
jgi:hypothetical protein